MVSIFILTVDSLQNALRALHFLYLSLSIIYQLTHHIKHTLNISSDERSVMFLGVFPIQNSNRRGKAAIFLQCKHQRTKLTVTHNQRSLVFAFFFTGFGLPKLGQLRERQIRKTLGRGRHFVYALLYACYNGGEIVANKPKILNMADTPYDLSHCQKQNNKECGSRSRTTQ